MVRRSRRGPAAAGRPSVISACGCQSAGRSSAAGPCRGRTAARTSSRRRGPRRARAAEDSAPPWLCSAPPSAVRPRRAAHRHSDPCRSSVKQATMTAGAAVIAAASAQRRARSPPRRRRRQGGRRAAARPWRRQALLFVAACCSTAKRQGCRLCADGANRAASSSRSIVAGRQRLRPVAADRAALAHPAPSAFGGRGFEQCRHHMPLAEQVDRARAADRRPSRRRPAGRRPRSSTTGVPSSAWPISSDAAAAISSAMPTWVERSSRPNRSGRPRRSSSAGRPGGAERHADGAVAPGAAEAVDDDDARLDAGARRKARADFAAGAVAILRQQQHVMIVAGDVG